MASPSLRLLRPSTCTWPLVGSSSPSMSRMAVVLPAPFSPSSAKTSPGGTCSDMLASAVCPLNCFVTFFNSMTETIDRLVLIGGWSVTSLLVFGAADARELVVYKDFDFFRVESAVNGLFQHRSQAGPQQPGSFGLALPAGVGGDRETCSPHSFEHPIILQLAVRAGDGVWVDRQLASQLAYAEDQLAAALCAVGNGEFHLPYDLVVHREAVIGVDVQ